MCVCARGLCNQTMQFSRRFSTQLHPKFLNEMDFLAASRNYRFHCMIFFTIESKAIVCYMMRFLLLLLLLFCGFFIHVTLFPNCISQYACSAIFTFFLPINCERIHYYVHQMGAMVMRTCSHFTSTSVACVCAENKKVIP